MLKEPLFKSEPGSISSSNCIKATSDESTPGVLEHSSITSETFPAAGGRNKSLIQSVTSPKQVSLSNM